MDVEKLQQHTDLLMQNISGFESNAISAIMQRIEKIGKLNSADKKALENLSRWTATDTQAITKMMAQELGKSIPEVESILSEALKDTADSKADLYEYQGITQTAFADDKRAQAIIQSFANQTGETMINLSKTKALNLVSPDGITRPFATSAQQILDQAVFAVTSGTEDFYSAMRGAISKMGAGGVRIDYGGGISRRLDTVIRQNILYATKMANTEYDNEIGDELNCDATLISYHANPRPSHREMGGKTYARGKAKTVNGIRYESDAKAQKLLSEYGCLHDSYTGILGISEPAIDKEELERLKAHDSEMVEYNGRTMSRYEWKQYQRQLETEIRKNKDIANTFKSAGDMQGRKATQNRINTLQARYDDMTDKVGLQQTKERMSVSGFRAVKGTKDVKLSTYTPKSNVNKQATEKLITGFSDDETKTLKNITTKYKNAKVENAVLFNNKGETITEKVGKGKSVGFTSSEWKEFKGQNFYHNHPTKGYDGMFSGEDIENLYYNDLNSMIASSADDKIRILVKTADGDKKRGYFNGDYESEKSKLFKEANAEWNATKPSFDNRLEKMEWEALHQDEPFDIAMNKVDNWLINNSKNYGYDYSIVTYDELMKMLSEDLK